MAEALAEPQAVAMVDDVPYFLGVLGCDLMAPDQASEQVQFEMLRQQQEDHLMQQYYESHGHRWEQQQVHFVEQVEAPPRGRSRKQRLMPKQALPLIELGVPAVPDSADDDQGSKRRPRILQRRERRAKAAGGSRSAAAGPAILATDADVAAEVAEDEIMEVPVFRPPVELIDIAEDEAAARAAEGEAAAGGGLALDPLDPSKKFVCGTCEMFFGTMREYRCHRLTRACRERRANLAVRAIAEMEDESSEDSSAEATEAVSSRTRGRTSGAGTGEPAVSVAEPADPEQPATEQPATEQSATEQSATAPAPFPIAGDAPGDSLAPSSASVSAASPPVASALASDSGCDLTDAVEPMRDPEGKQPDPTEEGS